MTDLRDERIETYFAVLAERYAMPQPRHQAPPVRHSRADFVADYELLRSEGHTRRQIADRLGMTYSAVCAAYIRAVKAGALTPDRRTA